MQSRQILKSNLTKPFKLEKFTIEAYKKETRLESELVGKFEAMYNPETFSQKYKQVNTSLQGLITSGRANKFVMSSPTALDVTLTLDDTNVGRYDSINASNKGSSLDASSNLKKAVSEKAPTLEDRINALLSLVHDYNGELHQSYFLKVRWGSKLNGFECFLQGLDFNYTLFNRSGDPLRVVVTLSLIEDKSVEKRLAKDNLKSPDMSRYLTIKSSDTLPHIASFAYNEPTWYIQLAQIAGKTNFRKLTPGATIYTAPIEKS